MSSRQHVGSDGNAGNGTGQPGGNDPKTSSRRGDEPRHRDDHRGDRHDNPDLDQPPVRFDTTWVTTEEGDDAPGNDGSDRHPSQREPGSQLRPRHRRPPAAAPARSQAGIHVPIMSAGRRDRSLVKRPSLSWSPAQWVPSTDRSHQRDPLGGPAQGPSGRIASCGRHGQAAEPRFLRVPGGAARWRGRGLGRRAWRAFRAVLSLSACAVDAEVDERDGKKEVAPPVGPSISVEVAPTTRRGSPRPRRARLKLAARGPRRAR